MFVTLQDKGEEEVVSIEENQHTKATEVRIVNDKAEEVSIENASKSPKRKEKKTQEVAKKNVSSKEWVQNSFDKVLHGEANAQNIKKAPMLKENIEIVAVTERNVDTDNLHKWEKYVNIEQNKGNQTTKKIVEEVVVDMLQDNPLQIIYPQEDHGFTNENNHQLQLKVQVENIEEQIDKANLLKMRDMLEDETMDKNITNISQEADLSPRQEKSLRSAMKKSKSNAVLPL
ncbi:hypothetical protein K7X08_008589 [Anisodus acutangulus]|uniref:Uncharacterized protein n=1 Tax=Anisodus acutangulus TaxID=402998 RepID=A0A9Q1MRF5_9SOLA|nr:hypothetical protein K7X08_008589 [Anisodus acutangulus]